MDRLSYKDFYRLEQRLIFQAMLTMMQIGQPIDMLTLAEELKKQDQLIQAGGENYLFEIAKNTPSASNILAYASIVQEKASFAPTHFYWR